MSREEILLEEEYQKVMSEEKERLKVQNLKKTRTKRSLSLMLVLSLIVSMFGSSLAYFSDHIQFTDKGNVGTLAVEIENNINLLDEYGRDILNPGDKRDVNFSVVNMGNKSIDTRTTVALTLYDHAGFQIDFTGTDTTQSEYDLYEIGDVELIPGEGYKPKAGATPLTSKTIFDGKIFYVLETSLNGNSNMYDEAETIENVDKYKEDYSYVLVFKTDSGNRLQDSTIIIDILTEGKQHENTEYGWELLSQERFGQGSIIKDVAPFEHIITDYYYPFVVGYNQDNKMTLVGWQDGVDPQSFTDITVPYGVEVIPDSFFARMSNIKWMQLPETVTHIGIEAFGLCSNMKYCNIPDSVEYIGAASFMYTNISEVVIPEGIDTLHEWTFMSCFNLKYVTLPSTLKLIKSANFYECTSLEEIYIPDSVEEIRDQVFYQCTSLTDIHLPENENYTVIKDEILSFCPSLKHVNIPDNVTTINGEPFWGTNPEYLAIGSGLKNNIKDLFTSDNRIKTMIVYTDNQDVIDYFENPPYILHWEGEIKPYAEYPYFN